MAPSSAPYVASQLRHLIYYHLDNNLLKNALFLAQRLIAHDSRSAEAAYLLSLCQFQSGFSKAAWDTSRNYALRGLHLGCCYVFAQACLELGRNVDGLAALEKSKPLWEGRNTWNKHNESRRQHLPDAAAILCLKGKLWKAHKNMDQAVDCWAKALKQNPFMWDALIGLCDAGAKVSVPNIYRLTPEMVSAISANQRGEASAALGEKHSASNLPQPTHSSNHDPFSSHKVNGGSGHGSSVLFEKLNDSKASVNMTASVLDEESLSTPSTILDAEDMMQSVPGKQWDVPGAPVRKTKGVKEMSQEPPSQKAHSARLRSRTKPASEDHTAHQELLPPAQAPKRTVSGQVATSAASQVQINASEPSRRSGRLLGARPPSANANSRIVSLTNSLGLREGNREIKKAKAPVIKGRSTTAATVGRVVSGNRTKTNPDLAGIDAREIRQTAPLVPPAPAPKARIELSQAERDLEAIRMLLDLFNRLGSAQLALSNFDCQTAIQLYNTLPANQRETAYVLAQIGKAYYEQADYVAAEKFFIRVKQLAPSRLEDMELYSTTLWHLKSDIELAYLAHELVEVERLSPQAWTAIGNSFSLQREHEQALKCFRRATQLDPSFAYGFTLQGHEHVANEEFEKALDAYRCAINADNRHYNAWYGLGKVYEKMGKWSIAETHFRTAAKINPGNAVLICCIGVVLEKQQKDDPHAAESALEMYTRAVKLAPKSALSRFKKARCLMGLGRPREALLELEELKDIAPEEANVWFLMGRLYKIIGEKGRAVRAFTVALNLDPKAAQFIKDAMESLDDDDEEMGMEDDDEDID